MKSTLLSLINLPCPHDVLQLLQGPHWQLIEVLSGTRFLAVRGPFFMNSPEKVNAPAAAKHPRVPPPIMIVDKMTTRTFDVHDNSLYSLMQSGLFISHQDGPYPGGSYLN